jgi:hypothetical protein
MAEYWTLRCVNCNEVFDPQWNHGPDDIMRVVRAWPHIKAARAILEGSTYIDIRKLDVMWDYGPCILDFLAKHDGHSLEIRLDDAEGVEPIPCRPDGTDRWHKWPEEKPPEEGRYMVSCSWPDGTYAFVVFWNGKKFGSCKGPTSRTAGVTHWRPLPAPPDNTQE